VTAVPSFKESSRELIAEVARALQPYFPDITARWREQLSAEFGFDGRVLAALERLTVSSACSYFSHNDFPGFQENLQYFGTRLCKLRVDTRAVARALELYQSLCDPYLVPLFQDREAAAKASLEMLSSVSFITISGAYFDAKTVESNALLALLDAELAARDLPVLLEKVLAVTIRTFHQASLGCMLLREPETNLLKIGCAVGLAEPPRDFRIPVGIGFSGKIAATGVADMVLDSSTDKSPLSGKIRDKAKSLWAVPLKAEGQTIGVLMIGFGKPFEWLPTERDLMQAIGDRAALAIERARMTDALREREQKIAELSGHLLQVQEEERKRISRELHDETGQALMVIRLYLGMMESGVTGSNVKSKIRETVSVVDRTIEGIRRIIGKLSPLVLQELGLVSAIRKEAKDLTRTTGVRAQVVIGDEVGRFAPATEQAVYRVVQEALHNVAKHAHAKNVAVQISRENKNVHVSVADDGIGIQPRSNSRGHSFGLAGIKERIAILGGVSRVISAKGKGTRIEISVPAGEPAAELDRAPGIAAQIGAD
jgi:two-component system, NarL family, sensor histidine kinase NreB